MWDDVARLLISVVGTIFAIVLGSVVATIVLRRFELGRKFLPTASHRSWVSIVKGRSWAGRILYAISIVAMVLGCVLILPIMSRVTQLGDAIMLLGAPVVMSGTTLFLYGVMIFALGKIVDLLSHYGQELRAPNAVGESKVTVKCPNCAQQLRIPRGNTGRINCPKCATSFEI